MTNETKIIELLEEILHELKAQKQLSYTITVAPSKINSSEELFKSLDRLAKVKSKNI